MKTEPRFAMHEEAVWHRLPHFSLIVPVPDEQSFYEQLITEQVAHNRFRLLCIPFFLRDCALGDVLEGDASADLDVLQFRVFERSGRSVFRVWFEHAGDEAIEECLVHLADIGALTERSSERLYAIDAADHSIAVQVENYLSAGEAQEKWQYETGFQRETRQ